MVEGSVNKRLLGLIKNCHCLCNLPYSWRFLFCAHNGKSISFFLSLNKLKETVFLMKVEVSLCHFSPSILCIQIHRDDVCL